MELSVAAKDGKTSGVSTARFRFSDEMFGLADLFSTADNTNVTMTYDATVLWRSGINMYVKDATGFGLIYGETQSYVQGDIIPAGYGGDKVTYNSKPELKNLNGFNAPLGRVDVEPEIVTTVQVDDPIWAH